MALIYILGLFFFFFLQQCHMDMVYFFLVSQVLSSVSFTLFCVIYFIDDIDDGGEVRGGFGMSCSSLVSVGFLSLLSSFFHLLSHSIRGYPLFKCIWFSSKRNASRGWPFWSCYFQSLSLWTTKPQSVFGICSLTLSFLFWDVILSVLDLSPLYPSVLFNGVSLASFSYCLYPHAWSDRQQKLW